MSERHCDYCREKDEFGNCKLTSCQYEDKLTGLELAKLAMGIIEIKKYQAIGTVEECAELMKAKKENRILPEGSWYSESEEHK